MAITKYRHNFVGPLVVCIQVYSRVWLLFTVKALKMILVYIIRLKRVKGCFSGLIMLWCALNI